MIFLVSKVALLFNENIDINQLFDYEKSLLNKEKNFLFYEEFVLFIKTQAKDNFYESNWKELGKYFFYVYQMSSYFYDKKHHISNIYNLDNFNEINSFKRQAYANFTESIISLNPNFNLWIKQILEWVL